MWMPGMWELVVILVVVMLIFGTSKLRNVGKDLGGAIKEFKNSVTDKPEDDTKSGGGSTSGEKPAE